MTPRKRSASRILLLDDRDRLLLLCGRMSRLTGGCHWFTVGGGIDPGEDAVTAAVRELREETALSVPAERLGPAVWTRRAAFIFEDRHYDQDEEYRLLRLSAAEAAAVRVDPAEATHGHRWWTVAELAATDQAVYPERLAELLPALLTTAPGQTPLHLGDFGFGPGYDLAPEA
ncbi:NUDIX hydrolase [Streptomyces sp. TLI_171]|uniref:NUDIX hydrolase n=1 Tax=Streptomyces sp. TLI_171 TaxID=1938859 RepID=UPI000C198021|nr:NUDIX domain-containing protein [Streptomyces sp. TLI_171]RKE22246.1 ADP-ribose pyrophosphatase YjhB (NUDIX family) [Streptomyces sp. TLI_171]